MLLAAGDKLGPYEIVAQIGAGGMGEVYRARDSRVGREVAVKVSAEQFNERSEREARAIAALNHPNVCTLHDVGPNYLVMELVEGEAPRGPLPLQTALNYARQIAHALDAAHEKGIVHRDLKPGNIKIKSDGTVKVLDFGLAKIASPESGATEPQNLTHSPTMPIGATQQGMILGTAAYMAPEQARGQPVDKRADIWAFGVVLYEMLTGRRAFEGEDVSSILAAVIQSEPRWDGVPANVRKLLESCLEKDPRRRLRDIGDVWKLLDDGPPAPSRSRTGTIGWIAAGLLAIVAGTALWAPWRAAPPATAQSLVRLDVDLGSEVALPSLVTPTFSSVVISPDGTRLVYVASVSGGPPKLLTRRLDQPSATELAGTEGAANPFFSPDGQWVAYWNGREILKVPVEGGSVVRMGEFPVMAGGHWYDEGNVVFGSGIPSGGVQVIPSKGGPATPMLDLASGELFHTHPQMLPGGKALLVEVVGTPPRQGNSTIDVVSIADRRRKTLVRGVGSPRYLDSGHLVYTNKSTMFAVPFDLETLETRGAAVPVLDDVAYDTVASGAQFDVSRTGTLVYRRSTAGASSTATLQWLDRTGKLVPLLTRHAAYVGTPRLSPDGRRIAIAIRDGANQDIWVYEPKRDAMTLLTLGGGTFANPVWSRDGRYVVFSSFGSGVVWSRADGGGEPQALMSSQGFQFPTSFTPDGKRLAYAQVDGLPQIWTVPIEAVGGGLRAGEPERLLATKFTDTEAAFSPDGRWIAYTSNESGNVEVYVRPFAARVSAGNVRWLVSNSGGASPAWSPNDHELLYRSENRIMAVAYTASAESFVAEKPRVWAEHVRAVAGFDLAPDSSRVAVSVPVATGEVSKPDHSVVFILNFFDELRRRAPIGQ